MSLFAALQFLTIAPPLVRRDFTPRELGHAVAFFPVVGLLLGLMLWGADEGLRQWWQAGIAAALVLAAWIAATGALHLDGFLDCCDGLFGGKTPEDRLRIMRDERVGAFAVVGGVTLLLTKYAALSELTNRLEGLLLAPALGRWGMALALVLFPYARPQGLGRTMKDNAGWVELGVATAVIGAACWFIGHERGLIAWAVTSVATLLAGGFVLRRLPGLTGDVYGAVCEGVEVLVLLAFAAEAHT